MDIFKVGWYEKKWFEGPVNLLLLLPNTDHLRQVEDYRLCQRLTLTIKKG